MQERVIENLDGREGGENRVVLRLISTKFIPLKGEDRHEQTKMMPIDDNMFFLLFFSFYTFFVCIRDLDNLNLIRQLHFKLETIFTTATAASKHTTHFERGQK